MKILLFSFFTSIGAMIAHAQYSIDWSTISGGGGTSTRGVYSMGGTIGQPEAGMLSGGSYSLAGGFWSGVMALQIEDAPHLWVVRASPADVTIFWSSSASGFLLEQSSTATGSWSQVPSPYATNTGTISVTASATTGQRFYRLRK